MKRYSVCLLLLCFSLLLTACNNAGIDIILPPETTPGIGDGTSSGSPDTGDVTTVIDGTDTSVPGTDSTGQGDVTTSHNENTESGTSNNTTSGGSSTGNVTTPEGYGLVPESVAVSPSFFDDTAFIGDSVSLKLKTYALTGVLGDADFFAVGSFSIVNALTKVTADSCHPSYQGVKMLAEDCVAACGAKKVYIMLGMNDITYGIESTIDRYKTLVSRILAKSPDVEIYIQSMTPMLKSSSVWGSKLNNTNIREYNAALLDMCIEMGWYYIDVQSVMWSDDGTELRAEYCSDPTTMGLHMTTDGCKAWVDYLLTHTVKSN